MITAQITVEGSDADPKSLWEWLREVPELRGCLREQGGVPDGTMGADVVIGVVLSSAALARALAPLARTIVNYLVERERQRRSDVVVVTGPDGSVRLTAKGAFSVDVEGILRQALDGHIPTAPEEDQGSATG